MICPVCKKPIESPVLICPHCEARVEKILQTQKIDALKKDNRIATQKLFKSKSFITLSIVTTLITLLFIASIPLNVLLIDETVWQIVATLNAIGFSIPFLITSIASWKTVASKNSALKIGGVEAFSSFLKFLFRFLFIFCIPVGSIFLGGVLLLSFDSSIFSFGSLGNLTVWSSGGVIGVVYNLWLIIFLIGTPSFVFFLILFKKSNTLYRRIHSFYEKLVVCHQNGELKTDFYYGKGSFYVFATFWSILAVFFMIYVNISLGLAFLFNAFYLVFFTLFSTHVKNVEAQRQAVFDEEHNKLVDIEKRTNLVITEMKRKQRLEAYEQQKKEEEREREREEIRTRLRQQQMIKEIMKEIKEDDKKV